MPNNNGLLDAAVGYARRSTDKQEASIPEQKAAVERYAAEHGYNVLRWYIDDAISGDDTTKRLDFQRMIADAGEQGDFRSILCWDQDRFGRFDSLEAGHWIYPLRLVGVVLVTVSDGPIDWNDFTGRLMYTIKQEGKHQFLRDLSRNVARGQLEAANNGGWIGSPPYAYRLEGPRKHRRLVIDDEAEVRVVRRIFREYVEDKRSMNNIADRLNAGGIPSPSGRPSGWRWDSVKVILENMAYVGDYAGSRYSYGKYNTIRHGTIAKADGRCRKPEAEWIVHRDHHEAIIDRATFEQAQAMLATGKRQYTGGEENPCVLSCLLHCGRCGHTLKGMKGGKGGKFRYYECGNATRNGPQACIGTTIREDRILHEIADHYYREFLSLDGDNLAWKAERRELTQAEFQPAFPKAFAKLKQMMAPPQKADIDRQRAQKQIKALDVSIDKARRNLALLDLENIPTVQAQIREMQAERERLELELRKRPLAEQDINDRVTAMLRNLWWTYVILSNAAMESGRTEEELAMMADEAAAARGDGCTLGYMTGCVQDVRPILAGSGAKVTLHTRVEGHGTRTRHVFERGEIAFGAVGPDASNLNPHLAG